MYLNIITPCTRHSNLNAIYESINIPNHQFRWIVVFDAFDSTEIDMSSLPDDRNIIYLKHFNGMSASGNSQRNEGLKYVQHGHIYFNDDDTTMHPDLWDNIKDLNNDFIVFDQKYKNGDDRLLGGSVGVGLIDSHNFIVHSDLVTGIYWQINEYSADGIFATACRQKSTSFVHIPKILSIYNSLQ